MELNEGGGTDRSGGGKGEEEREKTSVASSLFRRSEWEGGETEPKRGERGALAGREPPVEIRREDSRLLLLLLLPLPGESVSAPNIPPLLPLALAAAGAAAEPWIFSGETTMLPMVRHRRPLLLLLPLPTPSLPAESPRGKLLLLLLLLLALVLMVVLMGLA